MFPLKLQIFLIVISVLFLLLLFNMIKKYELQLKYALLWIMVVSIMIIISVFPKIAFYFTFFLGFQEPSNFIFLIGIIFSLMIIFSLSVSISNQSYKMRQISQEMGLLKKRLKELENSSSCEE
ncbi:DUF2304 domain-containing protein [Paenibacillus sp. FSL R5-0912]|uniref:DUF2304 domain-containing protein n=1 Tax=Paenibacillus sp. FSL R5-0912 TaxID=1536771 RepID=UPI0005A8B374